MAVHCLVFLGFLTLSTLPVRWCHFNNSDAACQVMSGSCVGLSSSFFRASESNIKQFFDGWFWLVGLASCWGFPVSDACWTVPLGALKLNPTEAEAVIPWPSTAWISLVFEQFRRCVSGDVILTISTLPVRWCQAVALAFSNRSMVLVWVDHILILTWENPSNPILLDKKCMRQELIYWQARALPSIPLCFKLATVLPPEPKDFDFS